MDASKQYRLEDSQTGHVVPIINGIYLHSVFNPIKEAESFADNNMSVLDNKSNILILGSGLGYHITEIVTRLKKKHQTFQVWVIEPEKWLIDNINLLRPITASEVQIIHEPCIEDLFANEAFIDFLLKKPGMIAHSPSFNLNQSFFKSMLSFKAPKLVREFHKFLDPDICELIPDIEGDFNDLITQISSKATRTRTDHLLLALNELVKDDEVSL